MFPGYHRSLRNIVSGYIFRPAHMPEARMGIGAGERLEPLPLPISREHKVQSVKLTLDAARTMDQTAHQGRGEQVSQSDFPMTGYIGEGIAYV